MAEPVTLRRAVPADAPAIGAVHVAAWRETYSGLLPDQMLAELSVDQRSAMWDAVLRDPTQFGSVAVLVAEAQGTVIGFGSCGTQADPALAEAGFGGEIHAVYLLQPHQRHGYGRALLSALAAALQDAGLRGASLWVLETNHAARRFYERLGGAVVAERVDQGLREVAYGWPAGLLDGHQ